MKDLFVERKVAVPVQVELVEPAAVPRLLERHRGTRRTVRADRAAGDAGDLAGNRQSPGGRAIAAVDAGPQGGLVHAVRLCRAGHAILRHDRLLVQTGVQGRPQLHRLDLVVRAEQDLIAAQRQMRQRPAIQLGDGRDAQGIQADVVLISGRTHRDFHQALSHAGNLVAQRPDENSRAGRWGIPDRQPMQSGVPGHGDTQLVLGAGAASHRLHPHSGHDVGGVDLEDHPSVRRRLGGMQARLAAVLGLQRDPVVVVERCTAVRRRQVRLEQPEAGPAEVPQVMLVVRIRSVRQRPIAGEFRFGYLARACVAVQRFPVPRIRLVGPQVQGIAMAVTRDLAIAIRGESVGIGGRAVEQRPLVAHGLVGGAAPTGRTRMRAALGRVVVQVEVARLAAARGQLASV